MQRLQDTRDTLAFMTNEELLEQSIDVIAIGIEDIFIAQTSNMPFSDEEIALYAREVSKGVAEGIAGYLKSNHDIDTPLIKKAIESIDAGS